VNRTVQRPATEDASREPRLIRRGFSLLEVVVVSILLAIISVMALPRFLAVAKQREEKGHTVGAIHDKVVLRCGLLAAALPWRKGQP
jgi:prepilin-type N-terminal cleavage/methylation domain-containing protein